MEIKTNLVWLAITLKIVEKLFQVVSDHRSFFVVEFVIDDLERSISCFLVMFVEVRERFHQLIALRDW